MRHEVDIRGNVRHVIREDEVHADEVPADLGLAIPDEHTLGVGEAVLGQDGSGIGIDDHLRDFFQREHRVENPAKQGLPGQRPEVLALDPLAVRLHGQQSHNARF
ncbi:hypothetical protein D3C87_1246540 [compost metagenome]